MMLRILTLLFLLSSSVVCLSQAKLIKTLSFDTVRFAGINPAGELFVVSGKAISKYDKDGKLLNNAALPSAQRITSFDSWHLTQAVLYYREQQKIEVYNPQLDLRKNFTIDSSFAIEPYWVAASTDEKHYWIFDKADGSLKKVNPTTEEVTVDVVVPINLIDKNLVIGIREYQRFLFLQTPANLLVFNGMGKHIRSIEMKDILNFDFYGEEIQILKSDKLQFMNLFAAEEREIKLARVFRKVLLTDDRFFGVLPTSVEIMEFQQN